MRNGLCVSVCYRYSCFSIRLVIYTCNQRYTHGFLLGFSLILTRWVLKKPSFQKLWREIANMLMFELTVDGFRELPRSMKHSNYLIDNW